MTLDPEDLRECQHDPPCCEAFCSACELVKQDRIIHEMKTGNDKLGPWMSAAVDDPSVCAEMRADVLFWFDSWAPIGMTRTPFLQSKDSEMIDLLCEVVGRLIMEVGESLGRQQIVADINLTELHHRAERFIARELEKDGSS